MKKLKKSKSSSRKIRKSRLQPKKAKIKEEKNFKNLKIMEDSKAIQKEKIKLMKSKIICKNRAKKSSKPNSISKIRKSKDKKEKLTEVKNKKSEEKNSDISKKGTMLTWQSLWIKWPLYALKYFQCEATATVFSDPLLIKLKVIKKDSLISEPKLLDA